MDSSNNEATIEHTNALKRAREHSSGMVDAWLDGGIGTAESLITSVVGILDEGRSQVNQRVAQTIEWAEGFPLGFFAVARKINKEADKMATQSIRYGDRCARSVVDALRRASDQARGLGSDGQRSVASNGGHAMAPSGAEARPT